MDPVKRRDGSATRGISGLLKYAQERAQIRDVLSAPGEKFLLVLMT